MLPRDHYCLEPILIKRFRRFSGLFWPILSSFVRGHIREWILPLTKELKIGSKEPENRQKLFIRIGSSLDNATFDY